MAETQAQRQIAVSTPLGEDVLLLDSMSGTEKLSELFSFELVLLSADATKVKFNDILGQNVTIRLDLPEVETPRYFNGFVSRFVKTSAGGSLAKYRATVVPWFWFLTRTADCRIFQEMTVPDIIKKVFRDQGFSDFDDKLNGKYRKWEYCVQYRETDFNFVSRLMEQEGIYYFFKHENGKHLLVLADSISAHQPYPNYGEIRYRPPDEAAPGDENISDWSVEQVIQPGACALNDFDFIAPKKALQAKTKVVREHATPDFEVYDYPGEYTEYKEGEQYSKVRINELQAQFELSQGQTDARGLSVGCTFKLVEYPVEELCKEYLVTSATYQLESGGYESDEESGRDGAFSCSFTVLDSTQQYRPVRATPKPMIRGLQTAFVVGKSGEEIWTDEHGRVKLQFHWDRAGKADENSSCWVRVAQVWAGKKWGAIYTPRIGQEVIVEFLEGDPDRPMVTGRVYNGDNTPPYALPANATMSTIKSNTSKGGQGFNEIRFEDKKKKEQIYIHAQKNMDIRVNNDRFETIGTDGKGSRNLVVEKDKQEHIKNNRSETVDNDHLEEIGNDRNLKVMGKEAKEVAKTLTLTVAEDVVEVFKKNHSEETTKDYYLKATNICIEATDNITIKVGDSFIAIDSSGIKLGTTGDVVIETDGMIEQKAGSTVAIEAGSSFEIKASSGLKMDGGASAELKGGTVKVN